MAQIFFSSGLVRKGFQTEVAFLVTKVKAQDKDSWGGVKRVMKYIKGTLGVKLTLRSDSLYMIKWWVDVSFSTHNDFQGYTGGMMSLGS